MTAPYRILLVEENTRTRQFLEEMLTQKFEVLCAQDGVSGVEYARTRSPNLILLDTEAPVLNGYDSCRLLKKDAKTQHIPIIFLSSRNSPEEISEGLKTGADDYIPKPFDFQELLSRIQTRLKEAEDQKSKPLKIGDLSIDPDNREVFFNGKKTKLTLTEFDILRCLAARAGSVVPREEIIKNVWRDHSSHASARTIDVHVRALRKKLPQLNRHVVSVYGVGYKYID